MVGIRKTLELGEKLRGDDGSQIAVVSAKEMVFVKRAAKAALVADTGISEKGGLRNRMFVVDLDEESDCNFRVEATLSRACKRNRDEIAFKKLLLVVF